jgi:uncharacterized protein (DUF2236 family)
MSVMEELVDEFAREALELEEKTGDEGLIRRVADALATSSPTMEERFLTAVRIRRAELRARALLADVRSGLDTGSD